MFHTALIPTDFSPYSVATVRSLPAIDGLTDVYLFHARDPALMERRGWLSEMLYKRRVARDDRELADEARILREAGFSVQTSVKMAPDGNASRAIVEEADNAGVDLIVMGARGRGFIGARMLGSVSSEVLRRANRSVLIMHLPRRGREIEPLTTPLFSRVCLPTDFSKPSEALIHRAAGTGRIRSAVLVHVVEEKQDLDGPDLMERLGRLAGQLKEQGIATGIRMVSGRPEEAIIRTAGEEEATVIMMPRVGEKDFTTNIPVGSVTAGVAQYADRPVLVHLAAYSMEIESRELTPAELPLAEKLWEGYHQQKADPERDRVFGVFVEGHLTSVARCRRHPDGLEVDGVFTPAEYRGRGYARRAVAALVSECGREPLYMHSRLDLVDFYRSFGFYPIREEDLPPHIRARLRFALGDMEALEVQPMRRDPSGG
ncbi:MAG: GNAT family N-acetyltransferase [Methanoculleaceae archaeon]